MRRLLATLAILGALAPAPALAYKRSRDSVTDVCLFWTRRSVAWELNRAGSADAPFADVESALKRSFGAWQDVWCSDMTFDYRGFSDRIDVGFDKSRSDNVNLLVWREQTCQVAAPRSDGCFSRRDCADIYNCWQHSSGVIALTTTNYSRATGVIVDADIEFNGSPDTTGFEFRFTATQAEGPVCLRPTDRECVSTDVQNTATHEIGHVIGFDHPDVPEATMYANAPLGETKKRTLDDDDIQATCDVYPAGGPPLTCTNSGHITITPVDEESCADGCGTGGSSLAGALVAMLLLGRRRGPRARPAGPTF